MTRTLFRHPDARWHRWVRRLDAGFGGWGDRHLDASIRDELGVIADHRRAG